MAESRLQGLAEGSGRKTTAQLLGANVVSFLLVKAGVLKCGVKGYEEGFPEARRYKSPRLRGMGLF